jgi:hypothetical protein
MPEENSKIPIVDLIPAVRILDRSAVIPATKH